MMFFCQVVIVNWFDFDTWRLFYTPTSFINPNSNEISDWIWWFLKYQYLLIDRNNKLLLVTGNPFAMFAWKHRFWIHFMDMKFFIIHRSSPLQLTGIVCVVFVVLKQIKVPKKSFQFFFVQSRQKIQSLLT